MSVPASETWRRLLDRRPADAALSALYRPMIDAPTAPDGCFVLGRIAQSLDGRIATVSGASQWISGRSDILHMHRLRALSDAGIEYGGWLPNYRVPEIFSRSRFTVHIPRGPYVSQLPGIPTIRPFEALACGIPLLSAPWPDDEGLFFPGKDFLVAADRGEMIAQLEELRRSHTLAEELRRHGLETIRKRHTCEHRVNELLGIITDAQGRKRLRKPAQPTFP